MVSDDRLPAEHVGMEYYYTNNTILIHLHYYTILVCWMLGISASKDSSRSVLCADLPISRWHLEIFDARLCFHSLYAAINPKQVLDWTEATTHVNVNESDHERAW